MHVWKDTNDETTANGRNHGKKVEERKMPLLLVVHRETRNYRNTRVTIYNNKKINKQEEINMHRSA